MKRLRNILSIFLLTNCSGIKQDPNNNSQVKYLPDNDATKQTDLFEPALTRLDYSRQDSNYIDCWCSTDILLKAEKNLDNLDLVLVAGFLATFHESCENNVEYSEWSNELLFKVAQKHPDKLLELISKNSSLSRDYIINELTSPLHDQINIDSIIDKIRSVDIPDNKDWKARIIKALETAKEKYNSTK